MRVHNYEYDSENIYDMEDPLKYKMVYLTPPLFLAGMKMDGFMETISMGREGGD